MVSVAAVFSYLGEDRVGFVLVRVELPLEHSQGLELGLGERLVRVAAHRKPLVRPARERGRVHHPRLDLPRRARRRERVHREVEARAPHLDGPPAQVVETLRLRLGMAPIVSPDVDSVPSDHDRGGLRVGFDRRRQQVGQVGLSRGVLDDGHDQLLVVAVSGDALDHLLVRHDELVRLRVQQRRHHHVARVRVQNCPRPADVEGVHEERRALGELERLLFGVLLGRLEHGAGGVQHVHHLGLQPLLHHARRGHEEAVAVPDGHPAARARDPPEVVKLLANRGNDGPRVLLAIERVRAVRRSGLAAVPRLCETVDCLPFRVRLKEAPGYNELGGWDHREAVHDALWEHDEVALGDVDANPQVGAVPHIKVALAIENQPNFLVIVAVLTEKNVQLCLEAGAELGLRDFDLILARVVAGSFDLAQELFGCLLVLKWNKPVEDPKLLENLQRASALAVVKVPSTHLR
mmetsp:Transcript_45348/g.102428  ORF Transcript_45348/g.102428 Transcript_45348/m.102428 type:complete len:463 (+) Transcript_45348:1757-3145(+)